MAGKGSWLLSLGSNSENSSVVIVDPSQIYRPEITNFDFQHKNDNDFLCNKEKTTFRNFTLDRDDKIQQRVRQTYLEMHTHQTVDFVLNRINYWTKFDKVEMTIMEALERLNLLVDESDPDVDFPNIVHAFQTAERIREAYPQHDWFHLTGLIHDLGKVMALIGEKQWAVVGDTFPVGCAFDESIVYRDSTFHNNPDAVNTKYNTKYGIYSKHCGFDNVLMSWGHDEYMYRVLANHGTTLPPEALYVIRYHSFYPWHFSNAYNHLGNNEDQEMLPWVREFNKFDLYTKSDKLPDVDDIRAYYETLIEKYIPGTIKW